MKTEKANKTKKEEEMKSVNRYEIAKNLEPTQCHKFFRLGAEIQSHRAVKLGFLPDANDFHETALITLVAVDWKSLRAARAMLSVTRSWM